MLSGGTLFDKGMYGCIFTPPLRCKKKQPIFPEDTEHPPISKLILKDDAEIEFAISNVIRQIPLWKNYFAISESICEPAKKQVEKELKDCPIIKQHDISEFRILSMRYSGIPIHIYHFNLTQFSFMTFVQHLIEAGALLNLFGIAHRDIHQGNILIDTYTVPRIIDFNLAIPAKSDVTMSMLKHRHNIHISQESPDSTLINALSQGFNAEDIIHQIVFKKEIIKRISSILSISKQDMQDDLQLFATQSKSAKARNSVLWFQTYWRMIDSWAIGINIIDLISRFSVWPEFTPILKKYRSTLFPLLTRMCSLNPLQRVDCVQALSYLQPNHFIIKTYGKAWLSKVGSGNIRPSH